MEEKIKASLGHLSVLFRLKLLMYLAESARNHADQGKSLALVNEARAMLDAYQWPPRYGLPLKARLAALRFRAAETQQARVDADATRALYDAVREKMVDIDRAETIRPLSDSADSSAGPAPCFPPTVAGRSTER